MGIGAEIAKDFQQIAQLAARRMPEVVKASECTLADADSHMIRMAIFHAVLEDKPSMEAVLTEIERMVRHELFKGVVR